MDNDDILRLAQQSMRDNKDLLKNLGNEKSVRLHKNPDQDVIELLKDLMPKSTEGKIVAVGAAALLAYLLLKR